MRSAVTPAASPATWRAIAASRSAASRAISSAIYVETVRRRYKAAAVVEVLEAVVAVGVAAGVAVAAVMSWRLR